MQMYTDNVHTQYQEVRIEHIREDSIFKIQYLKDIFVWRNLHNKFYHLYCNRIDGLYDCQCIDMSIHENWQIPSVQLSKIVWKGLLLNQKCSPIKLGWWQAMCRRGHDLQRTFYYLTTLAQSDCTIWSKKSLSWSCILCTIRPQWFSTLYSTAHYNYYFWTSMRALRWVVVLYLMGLGGRWCLLHLATDRHISLLIHVTWNIMYPAKGNGLCMMINITTAMQCRSLVSYIVILDGKWKPHKLTTYCYYILTWMAFMNRVKSGNPQIDWPNVWICNLYGIHKAPNT